MSGLDMAPVRAAGARVLVLGRSPEVLETVMQDLAELGVAVRGSIEAERAAEQFDARDFDLIAFGGGLIGPLSERLKQKFLRQNPQIRLLDTFAPRAVREIVAALDEAQEKAEVDLDAYCARIGYDGPRTPTLETLRALHELHPVSIVFEAIDVLLDRGIDLAPAAVDAKLIRAGRGGYCYEQNLLFKRVLATIGFQVEGLVGRVHWMAPPGAPSRPRTHMALRVTVNGEPWLADVGFGGCVPTAPLRMDNVGPQPTRHEAFRLVPFGDVLLMQAQLGERWTSLYELSEEPQLDVDYELPNWFTATHPSSLFRHRLLISCVTPDARTMLLGARLTVREAGGRVERRILDADQIEQALRGTFGLPVERAWRPVIERAAAAGAQA
jgi:N-hydroxyarylamine O-acetyltransferase